MAAMQAAFVTSLHVHTILMQRSDTHVTLRRTYGSKLNTSHTAVFACDALMAYKSSGENGTALVLLQSNIVY